MTPYFQNAHGELYHGDCLEVMEWLPTRYAPFDMVLTDPPYGTTACRWDAVIPFEPMWRGLKTVSSIGRAVAIFGSNPFTAALIMSNPKAYRHAWVWNKRFAGNFATANHAPMKIHEDVCVFGFRPVMYLPQMTIRDRPIVNGANRCASESAKMSPNSVVAGFKKTYTHKFPESILCYQRERGLHPTQKPVALFSYLIKTYTNPGETVLDFCAGSGTTAVAAQETGRRWVMIEKEKKYCEIIAKRLDS